MTTEQFIKDRPSEKTLQAIKELEEGKGKTFDTVEELFKELFEE